MFFLFFEKVLRFERKEAKDKNPSNCESNL